MSRSNPTAGWRRALLALPLLGVALGVVASGHWYVYQRLAVATALPPSVASALGAAIACLGASLVLQPIGERLLRPPWARLIAWPASLWMGAAFLLVVALGAAELVGGLMGALSPSGDLGVARVRAALALLAAGVAGAVGMRSALTPPAVRRIEIGVRSWPAALDGLRIVQVSDVHIGPILGRRFAEQVTERVRALAPDLIAVTGDLVDGSVDLLREEVAPFAKLSAPLGAFFVLGNHDCYSGATAWAGHVRELGMDVLRNQHRVIERSGARFVLAGVDDHHAAWVPGAGREDLEAALADAPVGLPVVLLAHDPSTFKRASARVDLQLSGHTHAGQIWPFRYLVRLAVPFVEGLYERTGARLYVSRGTGFWGPPMRLLAPAEITEIVLRSSGTPSPESTSPESQSVC